MYDSTIRPHLPVQQRSFNGVVVPGQARLLDVADRKPDYEAALCDAITAVTRPGDDVLILGAGRGVSAVYASVASGQDGSVTVFEASSDMVGVARETVEIAPTGAPVEIHHAQVGGSVSAASRETFGEPDATVVDPSDLPRCDVLSCDIEGAERTVLPEMDLPERVVVETHGPMGSPTDEIRALLRDRGIETVVVGFEGDETDDVCILASADYTDSTGK